MKKFLSVLAYIIAGILFLFLLLVILIQVPAVQNFAKNKAVVYLNKKLQTKVAINNLSIKFPTTIVLEGAYFQDQQGDTLLAANSLSINMAMLQLLQKKLTINDILLNGVTAHIYTLADNKTFNYEYAIKAFASKDTVTTVDTSGGFAISLKHIKLQNIRAKFIDKGSGINTSFQLGNFETNFTRFNLDKMAFTIPNIVLENTNGNYLQEVAIFKPVAVLTQPALVTTTPDIDLKLGEIIVKNTALNYNDKVSQTNAKLTLGTLFLDIAKTDISKVSFSLNTLKLHQSKAFIEFGKAATNGTNVKDSSASNKSNNKAEWAVNINKIDIANNQIIFNDNTKPLQAKGMDYAHIQLDSFGLQASNIQLNSNHYSGAIISGKLLEKSGLHLKVLQAKFLYSDTATLVTGLTLVTQRTKIQSSLYAKYPSINDAIKHMEKVYVDASITNTSIALKEVLLFAPQLASQINRLPSDRLMINTSAKGFLNNVNIANLQLAGLGNTYVQINGVIKGMPDVENASCNLNIQKFASSKVDLLSVIPKSAIPSNIRIPKNILVTGIFNGAATNFYTNLLLKSSSGNVGVKGFVNTKKQQYNISGNTNKLAVGYLTKQDSLLGNISMQFSANGVGFSPKKMQSVAQVAISQAMIKGYNYQNIALNANVKNQLANVSGTIRDRNLSVSLQSQALIDDKFATNIKLQLLLDSIVMKPLGLTKDDIKLHFNTNAYVASANIDKPNGNISIGEIIYFNNGKRYVMDSILVTAKSNDTITTLQLSSPIATANMQGNFSFATLGNSLTQFINNYYTITNPSNIAAKDTFTLQAKIIPDSLLFAFVPALSGSDTITANASFNAAAQRLNMIVRAPLIQYNAQQLDSVTATLFTNNNVLAYAVSVSKAGSPKFQLEKTTLAGSVFNNTVNSLVNIFDKNSSLKYQLGANITKLTDGIKLHLADSLLLDYERWLVNKNNFIQTTKDGFFVQDFQLSHQNQLIAINSTSPNATAPIQVQLKQIDIKTLTNLAEKDSLQLGGILNGTATITNLNTSPLFTADASLQNFTFNKDSIGNIVLKVNNDVANIYTTNLSLTGNKNNLQATGKYNTSTKGLDFLIGIQPLNLASIKPFSFGALYDAGGILKGDIAIKGTTDKPDIAGDLHFENASIVPAATGEKLQLSNQNISITSKEINFNDFTIADSANNKAIINGQITTNNFTEFLLNLQVNANDFSVLNLPKKLNTSYYGRLNVDADIAIDGSITAPKINADMVINKSTDVTFVLPSANPEIENRDGVVSFIDVYGDSTNHIFTATADTVNTISKLLGLDVTGTLQSDTAAQITLVIDERSGDALKIRGKSDLAGSLDKSGKISLTGNYALQAGSYQLSLSLLKKQFLIQPGSVITWTGDPTSATVDITAKYIANTQPINLLQSELANQAASDVNKYKTKLPFNVLLKMKGDLLKPTISFDIILPDEEKATWGDVDTKLEQLRRDEAEMNKQVFALLLLGRFLQENPLENGAEGVSLASSAKTSVSRILADQLNNLAGSLIKGVDLNFGINAEDDFSTGTKTSRTDLTVGVSKKLLNDRLRVSVGSNFELEGAATNTTNASNIAGDVAVDYLLSKDGRYALRGYRKNKFEGVVEGQIIESGVSFIFTFDFNEFKQIFNQKTEEQKLLERREKEGKKRSPKTKKDLK